MAPDSTPFKLVATIASENTVRTPHEIEQNFRRICSALAGEIPPCIQGTKMYENYHVFLTTTHKGAEYQNFIRKVEKLNNGYAKIEIRTASKFELQ